MINTLTAKATKVIAAAALLLGAPMAFAGGPHVSWSVNIGSPYASPHMYSQPEVVYVAPQPVYVQPRPVYVRPRPVYVQPGPVVYYDQPYYVTEGRHKKFKHRHWKRHDHDHDD